MFMNPPYSRGKMTKFAEKAYLESLFNAEIVVCLIPCRSDTRYWHNFIMKSSEIRFIEGRLRFEEFDGNSLKPSKNSAPFPSVVIIFDNRDGLVIEKKYDRQLNLVLV